ncbi:MAG: thioredoxin domain-containing protein [Candidatus Dormibacteraeota bacterium]|nr:thioredoxin domain-containing protein [Candidatus Dormibacteraeota bacterium]
MANRLAGETSPYLQQHKDNPVDWYPWGDEAFARARAEDRPVLLSIGYSSCHWCHVMAHESFENPDIAAKMNGSFVNIKVDREERPDVDTIYMQAVQGMTGRGGWPMTVFLTPDGVPYYGGTYFPPTDRMGMPAFPRVLDAAADAFRTRRQEIETAGVRMRDALKPPQLPEGEAISAAQLDEAATRLVQETDRRRGGFGDAPKFPHPMALDLLLRRSWATRERSFWDAALITLDAMARGGIFDQVGGGFHRYSVDGDWAVPHFEKMLYDNAQLVPVYLHAYQLSDRDDLRDVCTRTLDYLVREMRLPDGGFAASQDADSPGGEGAYFVWTPAQLREVLGDEDGAFAARVFGVTDGGNFEHGTTVLSIPVPLEQVAAARGESLADVRTRVQSIIARLHAARASRVAPGRDGKVITAWNALALRAFAEAGAVLQRLDYLQVAQATAAFLQQHLVRDGIVLRTWKDGTAHVAGFLEDVAHLCGALLTLYEATGDPRHYADALQLGEQIIARYRDSDGSYYDTASDGEALLVRPRTIDDNPVSAGQSGAAEAFLRIAAISGDERWRGHAMEIIAPLAQAIPRAPLAFGSLAAAAEFALGPIREIAIAGERTAADTGALVDTVWHRFDPLRVLAWGESDGVPLLEDRPRRGGAATAYVCHRFVCEAPVTEVAALTQLLDAPA